MFVAIRLMIGSIVLLCDSAEKTYGLMSSDDIQPKNSSPLLPTTTRSIIRIASTAIANAYQEGVNRQTVKMPLSESMYADKEEGFVADRAIGWRGGPQETLRYLSPLAEDLLREVAKKTAESGGLVPKIVQQVLLDFDGTVLLTAEHPAGAQYDIQAILQPNTDAYYSKTIRTIEEQFSDTPGKPKRLFLLINPAWRDKSSWGFFGANKAQKDILNKYESTFSMDQFVVRGQKVTLLRAGLVDNWSLFLESMPYESKPSGQEMSPELLETFSERPDYDEMDQILRDRLSQN